MAGKRILMHLGDRQTPGPSRNGRLFYLPCGVNKARVICPGAAYLKLSA